MKILVVSNMFPSPSAPSYGVFVRNFCEQLDALGVHYRLAVMYKGRNKLQKLTGYVAFYLKSFLFSLFGKYNLVYVHYASHSSPGVLLARKFRKFRIFTNCHGSDVIAENGSQENMQKYTRSILEQSQKIVVPSSYFKNVVSKKYGIDPSRLYVCASGGVNPEVFSPKPHPSDSKLFNIGLVGRLSKGKGWDTFLKACALLPDRNFRIRIVGDGPERSDMELLLDTLDLRSCTHLSGLLPQQELANTYNELDVFVFPTERAGESLGLVAVEAMACGCPVIASDFAAPADYVIDGVNGYKFPKGDVQALADVLQKFRSLSTEQRAALKQGALNTAQSYSQKNVTAVLGKILLE